MNSVPNGNRQINQQKFIKFSQFATFIGKRFIYFDALVYYCRFNKKYVMPRSHIHGSHRRFYYGLNLTDDPVNANFRSPIRMHYISMI